MAVKSKRDLIIELNNSATKIKLIRDNAALVKANINTVEPVPLPTLDNIIVPGLTIKGNN